MKTMKRLLSLFLVSALLLGLTPAPVKASLSPHEGGKIFESLTMSGAGAAQMDTYAEGQYLSVFRKMQEKYGADVNFYSPELLKARFMTNAMSFERWDDSTRVEFFIPKNSAGSLHELTLYATHDVDPADISFTGVTVKGSIKRQVFGDSGDFFDNSYNSSCLYRYKIPVFVPAADTAMEIYVKNELSAIVPLTHVEGTSPVGLYSTAEIDAYEEDSAEGTLKSVTLRVSGFSLPTEPKAYVFLYLPRTGTDSEGIMLDATSVSGEDKYGCRLIRFDFDENTKGEDVIWADLGFRSEYFPITTEYDMYGGYYFGTEHLTKDAGGKYWFRNDYDYGGSHFPDGSYCSIPSPYFCFDKDPRAVFTDVQNKDAWYYEAVYWAAANDVTSGMGEGTFQPEAQLSRAQAVMFLYKLAGRPDMSELADPGFKDVTSDKWYYDAVKFAVASGITTGYGAGIFQPNAPCTRAMIVTFLMRMAIFDDCYVKPTESVNFKDVGANAWYREAVEWAVANGITTGYGEGTFQPDRICNRAMMVTFIKRMTKIMSPTIVIS